ncbi:MAG: hypothetical protein ACPGRC_10955 [Salibacteraceae bacterium]
MSPIKKTAYQLDVEGSNSSVCFEDLDKTSNTYNYQAEYYD